METYKDHITITPDLNEERLQTLRKLFPDWFTQEGQLDINEVKKATGSPDTGETERYEFRWFGKSAAKRNAFASTRATLQYDAARSVNADKTENIIIEGENLEVLKILQQGYREKVKCIYIDPPYNTGVDRVYKDDFSESTKQYWYRSETGTSIDTNSDTDGKYHSNWLDLMYSRLIVARTLLREDGVIFMSIDDHEVHHLRKLCDDIFGEDNFVATIVWQKRTSPDARCNLGTAHDYITVYAKDLESLKPTLNKIELTEERASEYKNPDKDPRGVWASVDITGQTGHATESQYYTITTPSGATYEPPVGRCWALAKSTFEEMVKDNRIWFGQDGNSRPRKKIFLSEVDGVNAWTWWTNKEVGHNQDATKELKQLLGSGDIFDNPKPTSLLRQILKIATGPNDLVLDFFAGSGTTGHALVNLNVAQASHRKFILIQIPEYTEKTSPAFKAGYRTISEITIARNKAVTEKVQESFKGKIITPEDQEQLDQLGFKVFTLSKSSFPRVDFAPDPEKTDEENLQLLQEYIRQKEQQLTIQFNAEELITEILIKQGFQLTYKLEPQPQFEANRVYLATDGIREAYITVDDKLNDATVEYFLAHTDTKFICIERALDTTKKYNLKKSMDSKFFAF
ncbi:MAG: site-specific DNA-methyltransferase [Prevotellaceae bacterium]|nr:site-specific DNA-methyltransferase [Prevotellaceae bacterium]